jgi:hypothetical protein
MPTATHSDETYRSRVHTDVFPRRCRKVFDITFWTCTSLALGQFVRARSFDLILQGCTTASLAISTVMFRGSPPQKRQKVVEAWCRAGVTTAGVEVPRPSGQRDTACACGSLSRTDGRYTSKYLLCKESVRFIFLTVLSSTPFFPLNNSPCCLRLFSRLKSPSVCQRHVWRRCAQPSAIHCCCDTYRVHSACRRLPRIFYQSCQRCT